MGRQHEGERNRIGPVARPNGLAVAGTDPLDLPGNAIQDRGGIGRSLGVHGSPERDQNDSCS